MTCVWRLLQLESGSALSRAESLDGGEEPGAAETYGVRSPPRQLRLETQTLSRAGAICSPAVQLPVNIESIMVHGRHQWFSDSVSPAPLVPICGISAKDATWYEALARR